ncbi:MAG: type II secretion system protein [Candidatus Omnitrophica bacterium]|nr:type II secretion system protein [Candidatus Omnitrophota bacterium]
MKTNNKGFTIIELVIVFLVIGIIAAVSVAQMPDMEGMRISKAAQKIQSDIRFAQRLAMQLQRRTAVLFSAAGDNYSIYIENTYQANDWNVNVKAKNPLTQEDFDVQLNSEEFSGVIISEVLFNAADYALVFDRNGDPYAMDFINPATIGVLSGVGRIVLNTDRKYILVQSATGRVNVQNTYP